MRNLLIDKYSQSIFFSKIRPLFLILLKDRENLSPPPPSSYVPANMQCIQNWQHSVVNFYRFLVYIDLLPNASKPNSSCHLCVELHITELR